MKNHILKLLLLPIFFISCIENQENAGVTVTNEASANEETEVKSDVSKEDPKKEKAEESEKGET